MEIETGLESTQTKLHNGVKCLKNSKATGLNQILRQLLPLATERRSIKTFNPIGITTRSICTV